VTLHAPGFQPPAFDTGLSSGMYVSGKRHVFISLAGEVDLSKNPTERGLQIWS